MIKTASKRTEMGKISVGEVALLEWNHEVFQVVYQSGTRTIIRSIRALINPGQRAEREVSTATSVLPYEGEGLGGVCACGCGCIVKGSRNTKRFATSACRIRAFKRNGVGNAN